MVKRNGSGFIKEIRVLKVSTVNSSSERATKLNDQPSNLSVMMASLLFNYQLC